MRRPALPAGTNASAREAARDGHAAVRPRKRCAHTHAHTQHAGSVGGKEHPSAYIRPSMRSFFRDARRRCRLRRGSLCFALSFAFGASAAAHIRSPRACLRLRRPTAQCRTKTAACACMRVSVQLGEKERWEGAVERQRVRTQSQTQATPVPLAGVALRCNVPRRVAKCCAVLRLAARDRNAVAGLRTAGSTDGDL